MLLVVTPASLNSQQIVHTAVPLGAGDATRDQATARVVKSIFDYTRWPTKPEAVRLCVIGPTQYANVLGGIALLNGTRVERRAITSPAEIGAACDALYVGALAAGMMRQTIAAARGKAIVTMTESDPECRSEAMFCLMYRRTSLAFQVNIDAVSRSGVRIDPRVLRISEGY